IKIIKAADYIPPDEKRGTSYVAKVIVFSLKVILYRFACGFFSPMQPGLPSIDQDPQKAMKKAYGRPRSWLYEPPRLPSDLQGLPNLGALAVRGPFACYLRKVTAGPDQGSFEWNLLELEQYRVHAGLHHLGVRVLFRVEPDPQAPGTKRLAACRIDHGSGLSSRPGDEKWERFQKIALCALSNHMTLVRHWNWTHMTPVAYLAIATRNCLPHDHPLRRLLWPHLYGTQESNYFGTMAAMIRGGDFETIFSFTYRGMCELFEETHQHYDFRINDPEEDARGRQIVGAGFATPTQDNLKKLFDVMHEHTKRYVRHYYPDDAQVRASADVRKWLDWLNDLSYGIPNGVGVTSEDVTRDSLARLLARIIYLVSGQHEMVGSYLWNYQLWLPVRVYTDNRRELADVYQRLVNYNYLLNVTRTKLMQDFSYLALPGDEQAATFFEQFRRELQALQAQMENESREIWKIYPEDLEAHINA
ncbi:MAG: hypothetical protein EPO02_12565, partial [Nitrospirae bacterium]